MMLMQTGREKCPPATKPSLKFSRPHTAVPSDTEVHRGDTDVTFAVFSEAVRNNKTAQEPRWTEKFQKLPAAVSSRMCVCGSVMSVR